MTTKINKLIFEAKDWSTLKRRITTLSSKEKGDVFELFTKYYLLSHPEYASSLKQVWLFSELTHKQKQELNIPSNDQGIDIVAKTTTGEYWAVQCKYLDDENQRLSHDYVSTFGNLAFAISNKFSFGLVCTTAERFSKAYIGQNTISFCTSQVWRDLTVEQFNNIRLQASHKAIVITPYSPFPHQQRAIENAYEHFIKRNESRGKLIFPCGSGKSLTGFWIAEMLKAKCIIIAVPSLALVRQTLSTWLREAVANRMDVEWICVCSDDSIGKDDDIAVLVQDLGIPCMTDVKVIAEWLKVKSDRTKVVFTTYQSGIVISDASRMANITFDFGILDEAHKTVGQQGKLFSHLLNDENIMIARRMFMTATERRYLGSSDKIVSMDNTVLYGETFELLSFKRALEVSPPILSDYRIITVVVEQSELQKLINMNAYVRPTKGLWNDEVEARTLTSIIALRKAMQKYPIKHAVSFHTSIARAKAFEVSQFSITEAIPNFQPIESFHVTGATSTAERSKTIRAFVKSPKALITNARCLTEGVDIPSIDCVLFADPKHSTIDIVQAVGRALRVANGKKFGYVIIPVLSDSRNDEHLIGDESYADLLLMLRALASNDERIIEYFKLKSEKGHTKGKLSDEDHLFEIFAEHIDLQKLSDDLELRVWSRFGKLSWRTFQSARDFVRSLELKSGIEYEKYCAGEFEELPVKPFDIPFHPERTYKNDGWTTWGDWLGTGRIADKLREYLQFKSARKFAHSLNLKSETEWRAYCQKGIKPENIPFKPERVYKKEGWISMGDWLGTGRIADQLKEFQPFTEARKFVHSLKLRSRDEWKKYCQSGNKPHDIPATPDRVYKNDGWLNVGDWLGTGTIAPNMREYCSFLDARKFVHSLNLKSSSEWVEFAKSSRKPNDIPGDPRNVYKFEGWINMGDWLGTGTIAPSLREYRPFLDARKFVHFLNLQSSADWREYAKSIKKPLDIPSDPRQVYEERGWISMGDWIGTDTIAPSLKEYLPFSEARELVQSLNFKSSSEWRQYSKSGKRPSNIPGDPAKVYRLAGWVSIGDWLGTGRVADQHKEYRQFSKARKFAHSLNLKSGTQWKQYCQSGQKPDDIPFKPDRVYKKFGWTSWGEWLGTGRIADQLKVFKSFKDARKFVHSLDLKNGTQWKQYCQSGQKPDDIPFKPDRVYKKEGWISMSDWVGKVASKRK